MIFNTGHPTVLISLNIPNPVPSKILCIDAHNNIISVVLTDTEHDTRSLGK